MGGAKEGKECCRASGTPFIPALLRVRSILCQDPGPRMLPPSFLQAGPGMILPHGDVSQDFLGRSHTPQPPVLGLCALLCHGNTSPSPVAHGENLVPFPGSSRDLSFSLLRCFMLVLYFFLGLVPQMMDGYSLRALFTSYTLTGKQFITAFLKILIKAN